VDRDPLQSSEGWQKFTGGWLVGGLSGVAWAYILTQILPYCEYAAHRTHSPCMCIPLLVQLACPGNSMYLSVIRVIGSSSSTC
jgi:hypothetical protein